MKKSSLMVVAAAFLCTVQAGAQPTRLSSPLDRHVRPSLGVPLIAQRTPDWCWAACMEMVMHYFHFTAHDTAAPVFTQCDLAKRVLLADTLGLSHDAIDTLTQHVNAMHCSGDSVSIALAASVGSQEPFSQPIAYYNCTKHETLTWGQVVDSFARGDLVIFRWNSSKPGPFGTQDSHVMVAEGCARVPSMPDAFWVGMNDPWPVDAANPVGRHAQVRFRTVRNSPQTLDAVDTIVWKSGGPFYIVGTTHDLSNH
jgi:hypothetical protein